VPRSFVISLVALVAFDLYATVLLVQSIRVVAGLTDSDASGTSASVGLAIVAVALAASLAATWWVAARLRARS
jgi:hypothetical protein